MTRFIIDVVSANGMSGDSALEVDADSEEAAVEAALAMFPEGTINSITEEGD